MKFSQLYSYLGPSKHYEEQQAYILCQDADSSDYVATDWVSEMYMCT